jgi:hypothetical protein
MIKINNHKLMEDLLSYEIVRYLDISNMLKCRLNKNTSKAIINYIKSNEKQRKQFTKIFYNPIFYERFKDILLINKMDIFLWVHCLGGFSMRSGTEYSSFLINYDLNMLSNEDLKSILLSIRPNKYIIRKNIKTFTRNKNLKKILLENNSSFLTKELLDKYFMDIDYFKILISKNKYGYGSRKGIKYNRLMESLALERLEQFKNLSDLMNLISKITFNEKTLELFIQKLDEINEKKKLLNHILNEQFVTEQFIEKYIDLIENWHKVWFHSVGEKFIEKYIDKINWDFDSQFIFHRKMTEQFIIKYFNPEKLQDQPECIKALLNKNKIPFNLIDKIFNLNINRKNQYLEIILKKSTEQELDEYIKYYNLEWTEFQKIEHKIKNINLCKNSLESIAKYLRNYPNKYEALECWRELFFRQNVSKDFIIENIDFLEKLNYIRNKNLSYEDFLDIKKAFVEFQSQ